MTWLARNLLTLNVDKTYFITFAARQMSQPTSLNCLTAHNCSLPTAANCNCNSISRTDCIKYLGIKIDSALTWNEQINALVSRVRKLIFVFKNLRNSADLSTLKTVYFALAHSIITYCIAAWGNAGKCLFLRLERAQRAVLKVMAHKPIRFPTEDLYKMWKLPTVRHSFVLCVIVRKHSELNYDPTLYTRKRRSDRVCEITPTKLQVVRRNFKFFAPVIYNKINKIINIYPLCSRDCKSQTDKWLSTQTYNSIEILVKI
ncbi:hypothetical protein PYW08_014462 [Mythimna loreyi]|uniref:Uncharacterized protein n=1 Tax=Mythimna loreyi TaxID=667449 RepID=A0ACC2R4C3_9NEOP|nr:hypothetical protein PYW08_014462 [Mythimna loreyi]